jgi:hypothetical protein
VLVIVVGLALARVVIREGEEALSVLVDERFGISMASVPVTASPRSDSSLATSASSSARTSLEERCSWPSVLDALLSFQ